MGPSASFMTLFIGCAIYARTISSTLRSISSHPLSKNFFFHILWKTWIYSQTVDRGEFWLVAINSPWNLPLEPLMWWIFKKFINFVGQRWNDGKSKYWFWWEFQYAGISEKEHLQTNWWSHSFLDRRNHFPVKFYI